MSVRPMRLSLALFLAAPLAAAPLRAQGLEYSAGTKTYRVSMTNKGSQSSPMGNADFEIALDQQVTVNVMRHAKDTIMATITLDSISLKSTQPTPDVASLRGAKWVSLVSPSGKYYTATYPAGMDPALGQLLDGVPKMLPSFRGSLAVGSAWSDTISGKITQQGMDVDRVVTSEYKVLGDTMIAGQKAFTVQRVTATKAAGSGVTQGTAISMESTSTGKGAFFITPGGVFLGSSSADDVDVKITILAQNAEIGIKQKVQTKIDAIK